MSLWRRKAIEMLPELHKEIAEASGYMDLWFSLSRELERAYEKPLPNDSLIGRIYTYAAWSIGPEQNDDVSSAAAVAFYEHLPTQPRVRRDLHRWLTTEEFQGLLGLFAYFLTEDELAALITDFHARKAGRPADSFGASKSGKIRKPRWPKE